MIIKKDLCQKIFQGPEDEPIIELIDGIHVAQYLTPALKEQFIRTLIMANNRGVFDEKYFQRYMQTFERRLQEGKITLLLVGGEPAALCGWDVVGKYPDGRTFYELGNTVTLPVFQGRGFASQLLEFCFNKIRNGAPNDPILATTQEPKIAGKCSQFGMKEQSVIIEIKTLNPKHKFPDYDDERYERMINNIVVQMEKEGFRSYVFDPQDKT